MIRVLFLTESFHPVLGGGETHIRALSRALVEAGDAATVVARRGDPAWPAEEMLDGVRVVRVPPSGPARRGKFAMVPFAYRAVRRLAREADVVVVRGTRVLGLPGLLAARAVLRPVVLQPEVNGELSGEVYTWGKPWADGAAGRLVRLGARARNTLLRDADAFVAMSRAIATEMAEAGAPAGRIALIPHGVDTARFRPATADERRELRAARGLPAEARVVTFTGRLLRGKGLEDLVTAFAGLVARAPEACLVVVGSGGSEALSIEPSLREKVAALGLGGRVTFTGRVDDVESWLRASDVFAFPSVFEALGLSLLEAAACGLPAVGARTGGIVDVIDEGATGFLVSPGDREALADRLLALVRDRDLGDRMGRAARARTLERFDAADALDRYRALFAELAARRAPWFGSLRRSPGTAPGRARRAGAARPGSPAARA